MDPSQAGWVPSDGDLAPFNSTAFNAFVKNGFFLFFTGSTAPSPSSNQTNISTSLPPADLTTNTPPAPAPAGLEASLPQPWALLLAYFVATLLSGLVGFGVLWLMGKKRQQGEDDSWRDATVASAIRQGTDKSTTIQGREQMANARPRHAPDVPNVELRERLDSLSKICISVAVMVAACLMTVPTPLVSTMIMMGCNTHL